MLFLFNSCTPFIMSYAEFVMWVWIFEHKNCFKNWLLERGQVGTKELKRKNTHKMYKLIFCNWKAFCAPGGCSKCT